MSEQSATQVVIEAAADAPIALPNDPAFLTAEYLRDGADLLIQTADGSTTVVSGYFDLEAPVDLVVAGATVSGKVVGALARPKSDAASEDEAAQTEVASAEASTSADSASIASTAAGEPIGKIGEVNGEAFATRANGEVVQLRAGDPVYEDDLLSTGSEASMGVVFTDGMTFSLGAEARMLLDEFRYDDAAHEGGGLFSVLAGEFSFVSGAAAHTAEDALMIETPTMTIGVRGTKVVSQIDADGVSRVALLAEEDGTVGKIMVMTDAGEELVSEPNKMVEIANRFEPPSPQKDITATDVVKFFGEAVEALPAPHEFFVPKADAPDAAPVSPFAAANAAKAEAQNAAAQADAAASDAAAETSFAERSEQIAANAPSGAAPAAAPEADFTVVVRQLQRLANELAAEEPDAFLEALEEQAAANAVVSEALEQARETAEAASEASAAAVKLEIEIAEEAAEAAAAAGPTILAATSATVGEAVGDAAAIHDASNGAALYTLVDDQGGLFEIDANTGVISLATGQSLDYETQTSFTLTVRSVDASGGVSLQDVAVSVTDVNDSAQTFTSSGEGAAAESVADSAVIYTATAVDADTTGEAITFSLTDNAGGLFEIDAATGVVTLATGQSLDYENATSHSITIQSSDGANTATQTVTIGVTDTNDVGQVFTSGAAASAAESAADSAVIYTATATDADTTGETITFSLTDSAGGLFEIDPSTGAVSLASGQSLDYESATSHSITIQSSDGTNTATQTVTVNVTDANDVGQVFTSGASASASESVSDSGVIYTATTTDADSTGEAIVYCLTNDAGGLFEIDAATGAVSLATGQSLDYESATSHNITIQSSDGTNTATQVVTVTVTDANDLGPIFAGGSSASIIETINDSSTIYNASAWDPDTTGEAITFSLTDNAGGLFEIDAASGAVTLATGQSLDHETATSHDIVVQASDGTNTTTRTVTITVTDVNDAAQVFTSGASASIAEDAADSAVIYTATATDADTTGEAITFSLTDNAGGLFEIDAATGAVTLATGQSLDFETATSHSITIQSSDGTNTSTQNVTINVTDILDTINGSSGDDTINGTGANDVIYGGAGNDVIDGGNGQDTIHGGDGDDTITGGNGGDTLYGDAGADTISGGNGDETISGGSGDDVIDGGDGTDTAVFSGNYSAYTVQYDAGESSFTLYGPDGIDTVKNVENFQFDDQTIDSATLQAAATANAAPSIQQVGAAVFDGSDDLVDIGDAADGSLDLRDGDLTIEAWFYYDGTGAGDQAIVSKGNEGDDKAGYSIRLIDGDLVVRFNNTDTADNEGTAASSIDLGSTPGWHHVAMTIDQTARTVKGYLDGSDSGWTAGHSGSGVTNAYFQTNSLDIAESFMIGANDESGGGGGSAGEFFTGQIADVRIWDTARSGAEIQSTMATALDGTEANLVGQWALNEDSGVVAQDATGNSSGSLVGGLLGGVVDLVTSPGEVLSGRLVTSDSDGDTLTVTQTDGPDHGTTTYDATTGVWKYTADGGYSGSDSFSYQVSDGNGGLDTVVIEVDVS